MANAEELMRIAITQPNPEGHIVVGGDRFITVPDNLKRLGVQYDNRIETVTFDCPRYWDGPDHDMSTMAIYVNYTRSDKFSNRHSVSNVKVDENDDQIMHFDWTIDRDVTEIAGPISFSVCVVRTTENEDGEPVEDLHWNSEICEDCYISKGMESEDHIASEYPDELSNLIERMVKVEGAESEMQTLHDGAYEYALRAEEANRSAQDTLEDVTEVQEDIDDKAAEIRNSYASAIKGNVSGEVIRVDDVSPIEHDVKCGVHGKNLFDISKLFTTTESSSVAYISEVGSDYIVVTTKEGYTGNGFSTISVKLKDVCPGLEIGKTYVLNAETESNSSNIYFPGVQKSWVFGTTKVMTEELLNSVLTFYGLSTMHNMGVGHCRISNIQIEEGSIATAYEPYVDPETVDVSAAGKNLWHSRNITYPRTVSGVTINYDETTQIYTFDGTSTSPGDIYVIPNQTDIMHINAGETWTLRVYPMGGTIDGATTCSGKMSPLVNTGDYTNTIHANNELLYVTKTYTEPADIKKMYFYVYTSGIVFSNFKCRVQFEFSDKPSEFEKSNGISTTTPASDGTCTLTSVTPTMTLFTNTHGVTIEAEYNHDTKTYLDSCFRPTDDQIQSAVDEYLDNNDETIQNAIGDYLAANIGIIQATLEARS